MSSLERLDLQKRLPKTKRALVLSFGAVSGHYGRLRRQRTGYAFCPACISRQPDSSGCGDGSLFIEASEAVPERVMSPVVIIVPFAINLTLSPVAEEEEFTVAVLVIFARASR